MGERDGELLPESIYAQKKGHRALTWYSRIDTVEGAEPLNWSWILLRSSIVLTILGLLFFSQRFWYRALWRVTANWGRIWLRVGLRLLYLAGLLLIITTLADNLRPDHGRILPSHSPVAAFAGLWFVSALAAYFCVKSVHGLEWLWHKFCGNRTLLPIPIPSQKRARLPPWILCRIPRGAHFSGQPALSQEPRHFSASCTATPRNVCAMKCAELKFR